MTKSHFFILVLILALLCPALAGDFEKCELLFSASVRQPGIWSIRITGNLEDITQCLLMVTEPSDELLVAVIDPDADDRLVDAVIELNPVFLDFCPMKNLNLKTNLSVNPSKADRISFQKASLQKGIPVITEIVGVYSNTFDQIEFGIVSDTDSSECIPMARCGTGRPFWGPQCDPCEYTICCYGSMGFIQCGLFLCP